MIGLRHLGQAGFRVTGDATALLIDPYLSPREKGRLRPGADPATLVPFDAILATHEHKDHLDLPALPRLLAVSPRAAVVVPAPIVEMARAAAPDASVLGARVDEAITIGRATITPVPARHGVHVADAYTFGQELSNGLVRYLGYVIDLAGVRLYHAGDTILYDGMAERLRALGIDVALLPINGRDAEREARDTVGNLDEAEAADLAAAAGIRTLVPMHYDTIPGNTADPRLLVEYAQRVHPELAVIVPSDGEMSF